MADTDIYETIGREIGQLVSSKQRQYGDSISKSVEIMKIYYPEGIMPHQYSDVLLMVRIMDKCSRISQRGLDGKDLGGESPYSDICGYAMLGRVKDDRLAGGEGGGQ